MIRIAVLGDIGSGKSHIAKLFGYPVFDADSEVLKLYKKSRKCYIKLKKILPDYIRSFPVQKNKLAEAVGDNSKNLKKIIKVVHPEVRSRMNKFIKINKYKKFIILDIPLFLENKLDKKKDILIFIDAKKNQINKRLKWRIKSNEKIIKKLRKFQLPLEIKRKKSQFIIKNDFKNKNVKKSVKKIIKYLN